MRKGRRRGHRILWRAGAGIGLVLLGGVGRAGGDVLSTWNGLAGNWGEAANWTPVGVPNNGNGGNNYGASIAAGAVNLDIDPTVNAFTLMGGSLSGTASHSLNVSAVDDVDGWHAGGPSANDVEWSTVDCGGL